MKDPQAAEHVRFLTERLVRANRIERVEPELVDSLLDALRPFVSGADPHRVRLASAALEAVDRQNTITHAVLDDHHCRALEVYLSLPGPVKEANDGRREDRPRARAGVVQERGKSPADRATGRHTREKSGMRPKTRP